MISKIINAPIATNKANAIPSKERRANVDKLILLFLLLFGRLGEEIAWVGLVGTF